MYPSIVDRRRSQAVKPIVHFTEIQNSPEIGWVATVKTTDHPSPSVSNTTWVRTSEIVKIFPETSGFETLNTIYLPLT